MRNMTRLSLIAGALLLTGICHAQAEKDVATGFYRLDFVTREFDDTKVVNSHNFSVIVSEKENGTIHSGGRVPVSSSRGSDQFTYYDIGTNLDVRGAREFQGQLTMNVNADMSTVNTDATTGPPAVRQYKWASTVIVPFRKATLIFSSDDPSSKRKVQLEVTATPIK